MIRQKDLFLQIFRLRSLKNVRFNKTQRCSKEKVCLLKKCENEGFPLKMSCLKSKKNRVEIDSPFRNIVEGGQDERRFRRSLDWARPIFLCLFLSLFFGGGPEIFSGQNVNDVNSVLGKERQYVENAAVSLTVEDVRVPSDREIDFCGGFLCGSGSGPAIWAPDSLEIAPGLINMVQNASFDGEIHAENDGEAKANDEKNNGINHEAVSENSDAWMENAGNSTDGLFDEDFSNGILPAEGLPAVGLSDVGLSDVGLSDAGLSAGNLFGKGGWGGDFSDGDLSLLRETWLPSWSGRGVIVRGQSSGLAWEEIAGNKVPIYVAQADASSSVPIAGANTASDVEILDAATISATPPPTMTESGPQFSESVDKVMRFRYNTSLDYTFVPKSGTKGLGINEFDFRSTFSFPCKVLSSLSQNSESGYLFVTPEFKLDLWSGIPEELPYKMAKSTFDTNLDFNIQPQFTKDFGVDLHVSLGLASSFKKVNCDSVYVRGKGMGTLAITETMTATGGVIYYGRNHYKLMPSGGVIWKPNSQNEWRLVFPDPRLSHHLKKINETDWWVYLQGDIGGDRWLISENGKTFLTDYNDYRVGVGVSFSNSTVISGNFEVGGAFKRELYAFKHAWYEPKTSVYLRGGLSF